MGFSVGTYEVEDAFDGDIDSIAKRRGMAALGGKRTLEAGVGDVSGGPDNAAFRVGLPNYYRGRTHRRNSIPARLVKASS